MDVADVQRLDLIRELRAVLVGNGTFRALMVTGFLIEQQPNLLGPRKFADAPGYILQKGLLEPPLLPRSPSDEICSVQVQDILVAFIWINLPLNDADLLTVLEFEAISEMKVMDYSFAGIVYPDDEVCIILCHLMTP
jgi:hypothetical protein